MSKLIPRMRQWAAAYVRKARGAVIYLSVLLLAVALLLLDKWSTGPASSFEWLVLPVMSMVVICIGEWLSAGLLLGALSTVIEQMGEWARGTSRPQWWPPLYYLAMCILFATTTVALVEWIDIAIT